LREKHAARILSARVFTSVFFMLALTSPPHTSPAQSIASPPIASPASALPANDALPNPAVTNSSPLAESAESRAARAAADATAKAAFSALSPSLKRDVVDLLALNLEHSGTFQAALITWVKKRQDRDPASWSEATRADWFDPATLAPEQPTARHWLDPESDAAKRAQRTLLARQTPRAWRQAFRYDYASGELVRVKFADETARVFENALAGFAPELDLVEASIERDLDDRSFAKEAAAFAHAYTDRIGGAYPGITLYDAYASGTEFEMPDIDVLGILHALFDDADRWHAPIPATAHPVIYPRLTERFTPYHRHRSLRNAIARTFAVGDAVLDDGFGGLLDNFHALWEDCRTTPEKLRARLPQPAERDVFLEAWVARCKGPDSPYRAGQRRRATLASEALFVRSSVFDAMRELGVLSDETKKK